MWKGGTIGLIGWSTLGKAGWGRVGGAAWCVDGSGTHIEVTVHEWMYGGRAGYDWNGAANTPHGVAAQVLRGCGIAGVRGAGC